MPFNVKIKQGGIINFNPDYNGFEKYELDILEPILNRAYILSQYNNAAIIYKGNYSKKYTEETAAAIIHWPLSWFFNNIPVIIVAPESFENSDVFNYLGITLTHEFIHARQGPFIIWKQNFLWTITGRLGTPPFEEEAYNSVNLWFDSVDIF